MIPKEMLNKYSVLPIEHRKEAYPDLTNHEEMLYREFLEKTDYIPNKIIENLIENLATATLANFVSVVFNFLQEVRVEYKEVLECRKFARAEINRLSE